MLNIFKSLLKKPKPVELNTQQYPYLYHSDYYSNAWGLVHHGFFIDSRGIKYRYNYPDNWAFEKEITETGITEPTFVDPIDVFNNISLCEPVARFFKQSFDLDRKAINDLEQSTFTFKDDFKTDQGLLVNSLLVYEPKADQYRKFILYIRGGTTIKNKSRFSNRIINQFGEAPIRAY